MNAHWIDYAILIIIGLSVLTGLFRGFVKELIALSVWVLAIWLALSYSAHISQYLHAYIQDKTARVIVAFVIIILSTLIAGAIVNALLSFILSRSGLSGTDRLLGMGFGFVRGIFIVALFMLIIKMTGTKLPDDDVKQSYFYPKFEPVANWLYGLTPDFIKHMKKLDHNLSHEQDDQQQDLQLNLEH